MLCKSSGSGGAALESNGFERRQSAKCRPANQQVCRLRASCGCQRSAGRASPPASATAIDFVELRRGLRIPETLRGFPDSSRVLLAARDQPAQRFEKSPRRCRNSAMPSLRCVGGILTVGIGFSSLDEKPNSPHMSLNLILQAVLRHLFCQIEGYPAITPIPYSYFLIWLNLFTDSAGTACWYPVRIFLPVPDTCRPPPAS